MWKINGSERKAGENGVGTTPIWPLGKIAVQIDVDVPNHLGGTVILLLRSESEGGY
jgi:hypothetical protein